MKTVDREKLWESYQKNPVSEIREQIIIEYAPLVKLVAGRLSMYCLLYTSPSPRDS
mgnify:CR=1 FL=1